MCHTYIFPKPLLDCSNKGEMTVSLYFLMCCCVKMKCAVLDDVRVTNHTHKHTHAGHMIPMRTVNSKQSHDEWLVHLPLISSIYLLNDTHRETHKALSVFYITNKSC